MQQKCGVYHHAGPPKIGDIEHFDVSHGASGGSTERSPDLRPALRSPALGRCRRWADIFTVRVSSMWGPVASSPESHRLGRYAMTTTASTAVVVYDPGSVDPEHVALAGFLGGYRGLTRDAYALDLRQFVVFCDRRHLGLFEVRRSDIETFGRELRRRAGRQRRSPAGCARSPVSTAKPRRKASSHTPRRSMFAARGSTTSPTPSAWTATRSARSLSPPGSAPPPSTP